MNLPKLGISACLLGQKVRYDGGHARDHFIVDTLGRYVEWVPVCPEVECGLPVPREAMRLVGNADSPMLVTSRTGIDHTDRMLRWAEKRLPELEVEDLSGFIFKSRSPSSGIGGVKVYPESGAPRKNGVGIFGRAFTRRFPLIPAEDDGRLHDPRIRENFFERVFLYYRWRQYVEAGISMKGLVEFHTGHKYLIMAHSPKHYSALGRLVATGGAMDIPRLHEQYLSTLMEGARLIATAKKNANVLTHMAGYFKRQLTPDDKEELLEVIGRYRKGYVPLVVPLTLINHYVRKYSEPYLMKQYYLDPHPAELMLRNHV